MLLTPGEMLYYGGIVGMVLVLIIAVVVIVIMSGSRKRLRRKFDEEYGGKIK